MRLQPIGDTHKALWERLANSAEETISPDVSVTLFHELPMLLDAGVLSQEIHGLRSWFPRRSFLTHWFSRIWHRNDTDTFHYVPSPATFPPVEL